MKHLQDIEVLVLGLGDSGLAMARWCARHGARVRVWDSRDEPPQAAALAAGVPQAVLVRGPLDDAALSGVQLLLKSPGLAPGDARIAAALRQAAQTGIAVQGELELFVRALADLRAERGYAPKVLAITGTNGKTTTTAMTALLVERAGRRVAMAGNIGPSMLAVLQSALDLEPPAPAASPLVEPEGALDPDGEVLVDAASAAEAQGDNLCDDAAPTPPLLPLAPSAPVFEHLPEVWVLELSSFQLDGVRSFEPSAAAVLNVTQDHLDWHGTLPAYAQAKARIFGSAAVMVVNRDDPLVEAMVPQPLPVKGAGRGKAGKTVLRSVLRFGLDAPQRPGDFGLVVENGMAWLVRAHLSDPTLSKRKDNDEEIHLQRLMPADALRVRGRHNAANALAALALASAIGCPLAPMLHGLREYRGEPHRVEHLATIGGIDAYDDSKGTNVGATVAAIDGLGADRSPGRLVVLLGGDGKGQDFVPLLAPLRRHARAVATLGRDAGSIEAVLADSGVPLRRHESLQAATRWAFEQARPGDAVLLSPACASLDMFRDYKHRAEVFTAEIRALVQERGEVA